MELLRKDPLDLCAKRNLRHFTSRIVLSPEQVCDTDKTDPRTG